MEAETMTFFRQLMLFVFGIGLGASITLLVIRLKTADDKLVRIPTELMLEGRWYTLRMGLKKVGKFYGPNDPLETLAVWGIVLDEGLQFRNCKEQEYEL